VKELLEAAKLSEEAPVLSLDEGRSLVSLNQKQPEENCMDDTASAERKSNVQNSLEKWNKLKRTEVKNRI
jgi:hypothetical protein